MDREVPRLELEEPEREVSGEATATVPSNNPPMNQPEVDGGGTAEASGEHGGYGPVRPRLQRYHDDPYDTGLWCVTDELKEVVEQQTVLLGVHTPAAGSPAGASSGESWWICAINSEDVQYRRTGSSRSGGRSWKFLEVVHMFRRGIGGRREPMWRKVLPSGGECYTDFYVQGKDDELLYLVKKGSDEV